MLKKKKRVRGIIKSTALIIFTFPLPFILSSCSEIDETLQIETVPKSVFIYAGQSNASGVARVEDMPDYMLVGGLPSNPYTHLKWADICGDPSVCDFGQRILDKGDRYAFCDITNYWIDQEATNVFFCLRCARSGTSIAPGQTDEKRPIWYAEPSWIMTHNAYKGEDITLVAFKNNNSLTKNLTEGFSSLVTGTLAKIEEGYDVKAIMWHQGESDRNAASEYYFNFKTMIEYMRNSIYMVTGDEQDRELPFIFGTISHNSSQYNVEVESAQYRVAEEMKNVFLIDMSKASLMDGLHFDSFSTEYLGKMMFNKLVDLNLVQGHILYVEKP